MIRQSGRSGRGGNRAASRFSSRFSLRSAVCFSSAFSLARPVAALLLCAIASAGCATLAPQQRAILADPTMQFDGEARHEAALHHAIENREGSMGGTGVSGGGCGCN